MEVGGLGQGVDRGVKECERSASPNMSQLVLGLGLFSSSYFDA